jgi:hypothetical protein
MVTVPKGLPMSEICFKRIPIFHILHQDIASRGIL